MSELRVNRLAEQIKKVGTVVKDIANGQLKGDKFEGGFWGDSVPFEE